MRTSGWWRTLLLIASAFTLALAIGCDSGGGGGEGGGGEGGDDTVLTPEDDTMEPEEDTGGCVPACGTHICGPDGCGGECGTCDAGKVCDLGLCIVDCDGMCENLECGWNDVCNCGACTEGNECVGGTCQAAMSCDKSGFTGVASNAKLDLHPNGGFYMHFQTLNQEATPFDVIVIEMDTDAGGPTGPGVVDATYAGFGEHGIWLYILKGWNGNGYDKLMVPTEGQINITSLSTAMGSQFTATLEGVKLVEATYNQADASVNPVAHGESWCLNGVNLDSPVAQTMPDCVEEGTGQMLGDNIANFELQNCNGDWVNLHDLCKQTKALWFVATAGW